MQFLKIYVILLSVLILFSCGSTKQMKEVEIVENEILDTLTVTAPREKPEVYKPEIYQAAADRVVDLKHMDLDISFNWELEQVLGKAVLKLSPYFYAMDEIELDAATMDIKDVTLGGKTPLKYIHEEERLIIQLDRKYTRDETIILHIQYIASPTLGVVEGNAEQGLYFIDSDQSDPSRPSQIWSQGETECNHHWFPTIDKPNERYTHDIKITVDDNYATLSNGYLVSSNKYDKDTRTDHWRMDDEHAPYLTMITIGEFAIVKDQWKGKPLLYYVEKEYEAYAKNIFNHTPEMLTFFSDLTGVEYPWDQYAQVVIRDFVAGAMENTTAVTFGEFVQKTDIDLIDNHNDDIVAHEMFHHWFGDYVTCESWANLTLNEGFANYSEYLWTESKYGLQEADYKRINELAGYIYQAKNQGTHPLIHYQYLDKENMFDAHSYNKGGLVLHMLRSKIGDEAFFAGMKKYLMDHAGTSVEVDELRMAYEEVTGLDLQIFFNQWYLSSGHPELEINYTIDGKDLVVDVAQIQSSETSIPIFQIPLEFDLYDIHGQVTRHEVRMTDRRQQFKLRSMEDNISWVNFDPQHTLLSEYVENKSKEDYLKELQFADRMFDLNEAMDALSEETVSESVYKDLLVSDKHFWLKWRALREIQYNTADKDLYLSALEKADNVFLKGQIVSLFRGNENDLDDEILRNLLESEKSWNVLAPSLLILEKKDPKLAQTYMDKWKGESNTRLIFTIARIISTRKDGGQFDYILSKIPEINERNLGNYSKIIGEMILNSGVEGMAASLEMVNKQVFDSEMVSPVKKQIVGNSLVELQESLDEDQKAAFLNALKSVDIPE